MADWKKSGVFLCVLALCAGIIVYAGIDFFSRESQPRRQAAPEAAAENAVGVLDVRQAMQAHPRYRELQQLKKERGALLLEAKNDAPPQLELPRPDLTAADAALRQKQQLQQRQKLQEVNGKLKERQRALLEEQGPEYEKAMKAADEQFLPGIFNLELKLRTLSLSKEAAEAINQQIVSLKNEHAREQSRVRQEFQRRIDALMQPEKEQARRELDAYMAEASQAAAQEAKRNMDMAAERNHIAAAQKSGELKLKMQENAASAGTVADKEKEIAALEEAIMQDVAAQTAKIAIQKKLAVVLGTVQVNVSAEDITPQVVEAFKK